MHAEGYRDIFSLKKLNLCFILSDEQIVNEKNLIHNFNYHKSLILNQSTTTKPNIELYERLKPDDFSPLGGFLFSDNKKLSI